MRESTCLYQMPHDEEWVSQQDAERRVSPIMESDYRSEHVGGHQENDGQQDPESVPMDIKTVFSAVFVTGSVTGLMDGPIK